MRLTVQIWMLLALLLVGRSVAKATEEQDVIDIDAGSGDGDGDGAEPEPQTIDDDDNPDGTEEVGSGTEMPSSPVVKIDVKEVHTKPVFENTIRVLEIGNKKAVFKQAHNNPNSAESQEVFTQVCLVVTSTLQENQINSESCVGVSITEGSLVVKTKLVLPEGSTVSAADVEGAIQVGVQNGMSAGTTSLSVDPTSIAVRPSRLTAVTPSIPEEEPTPEPSPEQPKKPETESPEQPNKGNPENDIFFPTMVPVKPVKDTMSTEMSNDINNDLDVDHDNKLGVKDEKDKEQNFFEMILGSPLILAALVGGVVLTLITIILFVMFMIYRVKKKDEGSYSLDEPHKVKDPTTYWKDTKEFYA